jgi:uncharacterized membrane protein
VVSTRRAARAVAALLVAALAVLAWAGPATAKSVTFTDLVTDATVRPDGSMAVHEELTIRFDGSFTFGTRTFESNFSSIHDIAVSENGQSLSTDTIGGGIRWSFTAFSETRTFDIDYVVDGAVTVGADVGELYWKFMGSSHPAIDRMTVTIHLPGEGLTAAADDSPPGDAGVVRAWGHVATKLGTVTNNGNQVILQTANVPANSFVEARVAVPARVFTATSDGGDRLPTILREEHGFQTDFRDNQRAKDAIVIGALVVSVLAAAGFVVNFLRSGKEPKPTIDIGEYWREPLLDPPAIVTSTLKFGRVDGTAFASTLLDLAQRGYLTIRHEHIERFGPDEDIYHFTWTGKGTDPLSPYEADLLQNLFRGQTEVTSKQFASWARSHPGEAQSFWRGWKKKVSDDLRVRGYIETGRIAVWLIHVASIIVSFVAFILTVTVSRSWWGIVPGVVAFGLVALTGTLQRRTPKGADHAEEAKALRRYIRDFSTLDEAPVESLAIWEKFLVAAVALGVSSELIRGLQARIPAANQAGFAPWYIGAQGAGFAGLSDIGHFTSSFGNAATASLSPSSSGSSGGFSGGGGGGGGGGGVSFG